MKVGGWRGHWYPETPQAHSIGMLRIKLPLKRNTRRLDAAPVPGQDRRREYACRHHTILNPYPYRYRQAGRLEAWPGTKQTVVIGGAEAVVDATLRGAVVAVHGPPFTLHVAPAGRAQQSK